MIMSVFSHNLTFGHVLLSASLFSLSYESKESEEAKKINHSFQFVDEKYIARFFSINAANQKVWKKKK